MTRIAPASVVAIAGLALAAACHRDAPSAAPSPDAAGSVGTLAFSSSGPAHPGTIAFGSRRDGGQPEVWLMNSDGSGAVQLTNSPGDVIINGQPDWSPDGKSIAFVSTRTGNREIFVMNADGSEPMPLTLHGATDEAPVWSPNGKRIAFHSDRDGDFDIWMMSADGTELVQLRNDPAVEHYPDWSPSGQRIAFQRGGDIHVLDLRTGATTLVWDDPVFADMPAFSPDGRHIAFMSRAPGYATIYVIDADGGEPVNLTPRLVSVPAAQWSSMWPSWSRNGKQIYFQGARPETGNIEIWVVDADGGAPTRLTDAPGIDSAPVAR